MIFCAVEASDPEEIAKALCAVDLTLIETPEESSDGSKAALLAESDEGPALVAFTSEKHVGAFAEAMPDLLDTNGSLSTFAVSGPDFLEGLHEGF